MEWKRNEFAGVRRVPPIIDDWVKAGFGFDYKDDMGKVAIDCRDPVMVFIGPNVITHYRLHDPSNISDNVVYLIRVSIEPSIFPPELGLSNGGPFYAREIFGSVESAKAYVEQQFHMRNAEPNLFDNDGNPTATDRMVLWAGDEYVDIYDGQWQSELESRKNG